MLPNLKSKADGAKHEESQGIHQPTLFGVPEMDQVLHHPACLMCFVLMSISLKIQSCI